MRSLLPRPCLLLAALFLSAACDNSPPEPTGKGTSPNASIKPAPLTSGEPELRPDQLPRALDAGVVGLPVDSAGQLIIPAEAGAPPPSPLRSDEGLASDEVSTRDSSGLTLTVEWHWDNADKPPAGSATNPEALELLRERTKPQMTVDLSNAGRMRVQLDSVVFPLPPGTELRSRTDRSGHVVVWPNRRAYRGISPGGLRALFGERRADVTPTSAGKNTAKGKGSKLGFETVKTEISSAFGTLNLEQAKLPGTRGHLFCRFLTELIAVDPLNEACVAGLVPIAARFQWKPSGSITLAVTTLTRRTDLQVGELRVPSSGAQVKPGELPPQTTGILLGQPELRSMRRTDAQDITPAENAPGEGMRAVNHSDGLRYVLLDGVPVAWVEPLGQTYIIGPPKGYYNISWRDFLGAHVEPTAKIALPARVTLGEEPVDAGPPEVNP